MSARVGFHSCGISKAGFLEEEAPRLEQYLKAGFHGTMSYMENYFDMRLDPTKLVPGAKTVVSLLFNYYPEKKQENNDALIAKYAYGEDYHKVLKDKCRLLVALIRENIGEVQGRAFSDSAPVMDRVWAQKSGLGWIGKHGLLITRKAGSFFFIAELIIDLECAPDTQIADFCGTCNACVDACPTDAILDNKTLNASKCISYLTIELRENIPSSLQNKLNNWVFGCDICQDVCPWNRFSKPHKEPAFTINPLIEKNTLKDWLEISEEVFSQQLSKSPIKRTKYEGFMRNLKVVEAANK